jgi:hypothetical protein
MIKPTSNIIFQILSLGNQEDTPFRVAYKNYMFNLFLLLATPFAFLVMCINFYIGAYTLAFFNVAHLLIFVVGYYISYSQSNCFSHFLSFQYVSIISKTSILKININLKLHILN